MNKVNVIKQNLEFIGKTWIKYIGTFASILSLFFLFHEQATAMQGQDDRDLLRKQ